jgi:hypothetical protein
VLALRIIGYIIAALVIRAGLITGFARTAIVGIEWAFMVAAATTPRFRVVMPVLKERRAVGAGRWALLSVCFISTWVWASTEPPASRPNTQGAIAGNRSAWQNYSAASRTLFGESEAAARRFASETTAADSDGAATSLAILRRDADQLAQLRAPDPVLQSIVNDYARAMSDEEAHCVPAVRERDMYAHGCLADITRSADLMRRMSTTLDADLKQLDL